MLRHPLAGGDLQHDDVGVRRFRQGGKPAQAGMHETPWPERIMTQRKLGMSGASTGGATIRVPAGRGARACGRTRSWRAQRGSRSCSTAPPAALERADAAAAMRVSRRREPQRPGAGRRPAFPRNNAPATRQWDDATGVHCSCQDRADAGHGQTRAGLSRFQAGC